MSILADLDLSTPPVAQLGQWMMIFFYLSGAIGAVIGCAVGVKKLRAREGNPQPFEVREHKEYATKEELQKVDQRVHELDARIETNFRDLDKKRSTSIAGLHDDLRTTTAAMNARIDAVPAATIALLNETRQLHRR